METKTQLHKLPRSCQQARPILRQPSDTLRNGDENRLRA